MKRDRYAPLEKALRCPYCTGMLSVAMGPRPDGSRGRMLVHTMPMCVQFLDLPATEILSAAQRMRSN